MSKPDNSYKSILKGTSIFGGVKIFEILINLVRGKFVAIFLGPVGIGISSILSNVAVTVSQLASCGLNLAIVKEVAGAREDTLRLSEIIHTGKRLFRLTAILGFLISIILAPVLSSVSFGDNNYTLQFAILPIAIFVMIDNGGRLSLLQGLQEVKRLSKASLIGSLTGLLIGVPLYWRLGNQGIAPAIASLAISQNIFYRFQLRRACRHLPPPPPSPLFRSSLVKKLFSLGIILLLSDIIGNVCNYALLILTRKIGNIDDVGFFQAANSVTNQMAGVVFTAMSLDFFPRLSACAGDTTRMNRVVDRQSEVVSFIILPLSLLLILFAPLIVRILLTSKFEVIVTLLHLMAVGVILKAMAFPMGYISFAKDNKRVFFWLEGIVGNFLMLSVPLLFFYIFGLIGFGYGMIAEQALCFIIYLLINNRLYGYKPSRKTVMAFTAAILLSFSALISSFIPNPYISYALTVMLTLAAIGLSLIQLRKRLIVKDVDKECP